MAQFCPMNLRDRKLRPPFGLYASFLGIPDAGALSTRLETLQFIFIEQFQRREVASRAETGCYCYSISFS
jgi:hypothetical protein